MRRILVATDGSESSERAVSKAAELAAGLKLPLVVVHVTADGSLPEGLMAWAAVEFPESALLPEGPAGLGPATWVPGLSGDVGTGGLSGEVEQAILSDAVAAARSAGVEEVEGRLLEGHAAQSIVAAADAAGADMIVLGSHGRGAVGRVVLGSISEGVLHRTKTPVLVVH